MRGLSQNEEEEQKAEPQAIAKELIGIDMSSSPVPAVEQEHKVEAEKTEEVNAPSQVAKTKAQLPIQTVNLEEAKQKEKQAKEEEEKRRIEKEIKDKENQRKELIEGILKKLPNFEYLIATSVVDFTDVSEKKI